MLIFKNVPEITIYSGILGHIIIEYTLNFEATRPWMQVGVLKKLLM